MSGQVKMQAESGSAQNATVPTGTGSVKPCVKCGAADRSPKSGRCLPCHKARHAKYYAEHPEQMKARSVKHYADHSEQMKASSNKWNAEHREQMKAYTNKWRAQHPENKRAWDHKRRAQKRMAGGSFSAAEIQALLKQQKKKCVYCPVDISKAYHIDHYMPLALGGHNGIANIQLLCPPCNQAKSDKHPIDFMQSKGFLL